MENKLLSNIDAKLLKAELQSLISDIKLSIAFVVDVNHDGRTSSKLAIGEVLAKSIEDTGTNEVVDKVYKPIVTTITNYPLVGEYILCFTHEMGSYYISTLNYLNNPNNDINLDNISAMVKYSDDDKINKFEIKSDNRNRETILDRNQDSFSETSNLKTVLLPKKFGDIIYTGRFGGYLRFTSTDINTSAISLSNENSSILMTRTLTSYEPITDVNRFNKTVQRNDLASFSGNQIYHSSQRLFFESSESGIWFQTRGNFSVLTDSYITFDTDQPISLKSTRVDLGYNSTEQEIGQQVVLGNDFVEGLESFVKTVNGFLDIARQDAHSFTLKLAAETTISNIKSIRWDNSNIKNTLDKYLSKTVYSK